MHDESNQSHERIAVDRTKARHLRGLPHAHSSRVDTSNYLLESMDYQK
jgi:hypothetical protein